MNIGVRTAGHEPSGVLEKKTQKCALRVHFTVEKGISLLGEIQTKIGLFHHIFFQKGRQTNQTNSKFMGIFSPPRIRHLDEISGVLPHVWASVAIVAHYDDQTKCQPSEPSPTIMPTTVTLGKRALSSWFAYPLEREKTLARAPN